MTVEQTTQAPTQTTQDQPPVTETTKPAEATDQDKTIGGIKFYREQLERERAEKEKVYRELEEAKTSKMKEQNQWKELYEQEQKKAEEAHNKLKTVSTALVEDKMSAVIEREAIAAGILPSALEDMDLLDRSMIEVETTSTGRVNFHNVKEFINSVKMRKPHWFGAHQDPNINTRRPGTVQTTELNAEQILDLQINDPKKYNEIMRQRLGHKQ